MLIARRNPSYRRGLPGASKCAAAQRRRDTMGRPPARVVLYLGSPTGPIRPRYSPIYIPRGGTPPHRFPDLVEDHASALYDQRPPNLPTYARARNIGIPTYASIAIPKKPSVLFPAGPHTRRLLATARRLRIL